MVGYVPPPGVSIKDVLISQFGEKIGLTLEEVYNLLAGHLEITEDLALRIQNAIGMPRHYLLNIERQYRESLKVHDPQ